MNSFELNRFNAARDIALVVVCGFGVRELFSRFAWEFASIPAAACVIVLTSYLLVAQGSSWCDVGLRLPRDVSSFFLTLLQAGLAMIVTMVAGGLAGVGAEFLFGEAPAGPDRFGNVAGNLPVLIFWVATGWLVGGIVEELVFRGFLISRFQTLLGGRWFGASKPLLTFLSIAAPALIFGLAHYYYRGIHGAVVITVVGISLGIFYLAYGRKLLPLIFAHGSIDTLSFLARYLDADW